MGESFLEYPLPADWVPSAYQDTLEDIDPLARKWFQKYYTPTLQIKESLWEELIPTLRDNSVKRVTQNRNFQNFIKTLQDKELTIDKISFGINDLQMEEAVNIVKDMIFLSQPAEISP